jgi:O-antigen biosynthesis protein
MVKKKASIAFIIYLPESSGGVYVVLEHALRLSQKGYSIYIVMEKSLSINDLYWFPAAKSLKWITFEEAEEIFFDAVISTWWLTCYSAYKLKAKAYIYFNQSVESKFYPPECWLEKKYAESTYFLGMHIITEASWIKFYLKNNYGLNSQLVLNGIRKDIFTPDGNRIDQRNPGKVRILVEGPLGVFFKNTEKTIELCLKSKADEVWFLTNSDLIRYRGVDRVFSKVPIIKTPEIYRSCDLLVKLSYVEGMFGPPLEMFHCGGTAIVYDVTGHDEYIKNDFNAYVVSIEDEERVVELIDYLKMNPEELARLKQGALETASRWDDWAVSSANYEKAILRILNSEEDCIIQLQLKNKTLHFQEWYECTLGNNKIKKLILEIKKWIKKNSYIYKFIKILKQYLVQ